MYLEKYIYKKIGDYDDVLAFLFLFYDDVLH